MVLLCCTSSLSYSDTTGNILNPNVIQGTYESCSGSGCWGGLSGGQVPSWNGSTAYWGYGGGQLRWQYALEQALRDAGINIDGYNYSFFLKNKDANASQNDGDDYMRISVRFYDSSGSEVYGKHHNFDGTYDWTRFNGQDMFTTPIAGDQIDYVIIRAEGDDNGFWAGHYGPEFDAAQSSITLIYSNNPCYPDPLVNPMCPGYAEAYANKLLEEQLAAQQEAALATPEVQSTVETTPTETFSSPTTPQVQLGGTENTGANPESTGQLTVQEKRNSDDDKKQKLDLVRNLDAANNFDLSSVTGGPTEDPLAMDVVEQAIGGVLNDLENIEGQTIGGMGSIQTQAQSSVASNQTNTESRQERRERLKEITENRANEISDENSGADNMDEQAQQQMEQLALMNYVPGFNAYQVALPGGMYPDVEFYKPTTVPESKRGLRNGLAQQLLHEQMIDMQYRREK